MSLVEIKLSKDESVWIEAEDGSVGPTVHFQEEGVVDASLAGDMRAASAGAIVKMDFQQVLVPIKGLARDMSAAFATLDIGPDSYEITLGVKVTADAGVVFAKAGGEASIEVKMSWEGLRKPKVVAPNG